MNLGDFLKKNADTIGNELLGRISDAAGGPELPPLSFSDPYENSNAYVSARPAPATPAAIVPEAPRKKNWLMYGAIGVGAILVIGLLMKRR